MKRGFSGLCLVVGVFFLAGDTGFCNASLKSKFVGHRKMENEAGPATSQVEPPGPLHTESELNKAQFDEPKQKWNYVNVRNNAFMFWWLYFTTDARGYQQRPLVIWLQGGPGASSTGFGNFQEIGPLTVDLKPRQATWLKQASLLFVDNPVGTGYSYVTQDDAYTTDVATIANDLLAMMSEFLKENPDFETVPVYVFSESYGGKMAAAFSNVLYKAIATKHVKCDFMGVAMGDSWISPIDSVLTWGPYLYSTSLVDEAGLKAVNDVATAAKEAVDGGRWLNATNLWAKAENVIANWTNGVNLYNIIDWNSDLSSQRMNNKKVHKIMWRIVDSLAEHALRAYHQDSLAELMNGPIRKKLGIIPKNVTWGGQAGPVFEKQSVDFMKPVVDIVDELLQQTDLKVVVYSGQLDLIVDTMGTEKWVQKLNWPDLVQYNKASRKPLLSKDGTTIAFVKSYKNFSFYWILDAGHMIPADQPETATLMLTKIIN